MKSPLSHRFGSGLTGIALAYGAGAWLLIEAVATLHGDLGLLPQSLVNVALGLILVGFPIVMVTAWAQLRSKGGDGAADGSRVSALFTWRNAALGGLCALALWGVWAAVWIGATGGPAVARSADDEVQVLAVLPFENLLPEGEEQDWLVAGLHDQVIHEIQRLQLPGLRVLSRTSVMAYADSDLTLPEIAEQLGVDAVLEGTVTADGDGRLHAVMQLIDAATDHHRWSHDYDARLEESFHDARVGIATRIARSFTDAPESALRRELLDERPTDEEEAYRAYMRGLYLYGQLGAPAASQASEYFQRAVELDPGFALAWAALAETWLSSAHFGTPPNVAFPNALAAAVQATTRAPELAEGHVVLADARFHYNWDWELAEAEFREGLRLNPSHATGHWFYAGLLGALGRTDDAAVQLEHARRMNPVDPITEAFGGRVMYWGRRYDEAETMVRAALRLAPSNFYAWGTLGYIHLARGEVDEAVAAFRRSNEINGKFASGLAMALALAGEVEEARSIAEGLDAMAEERYVAPYERAFAWVGLGDHQHALDLLEEATETRDAELIWVAVEPAFDPIREDPRFRAILDRMGLAHLATGPPRRRASKREPGRR